MHRDSGWTRSVPQWLAGGAAVALGVVVLLAALAGGTPYTQVGNGDPGLLVSVGAPVLRLLADLSGTVCVGALVFVVTCTRPREGKLTGAGYGEVRWAAVAAGVWAVSAVLLVPFSAADTGGLPLPVVLANLPGLLGALEQPKAWLCTALLALLVAAGARMTLRWAPAALWCGVSVFAALPPLVTAHGSSDTGHDLSLAAIVVHVPAAMIWFGLLLAVLRQARRPSGDLASLVRRYDRAALWCWVVLALSGLVLGGVLVPAADLFTTAYGLALVTKMVLAVAAGIAGRLLARRAARKLATRPGDRRGVLAFAAAEVTLLSAVVGFSVGLSHLPLPGFLGKVLSTTRTLLGYDLAGPPTVLRLLGDWRPDLFFGPLALLLLVGYLIAVRRLGGDWPRTRTAAWIAGCAVLVLATCSGIGRYAAAMFSVHQASHMLVSMLAPALLVQGAPLSLLARAAPAGLPGFAEVTRRLAGTRLVRVLTHPAVALVLFAGSPFLLYFTGLFDALVRFHWGHLLINVWFLAVGYLFFWVVAGEDPAPRPLPAIARLGVLLAAMPADILFGAILIGGDRIVGNGPASSNLYQALALPWVPDLAADQRAAGLIALVLGELTLLVALGALLARWARDDGSGFADYEQLARTVRAESG
ncbi:cytochrome c oxidase assembly protein [Amycolatopsis sp. GM8]|uniref:cytochrome c oxidase assembly protein n=1 Tax=Amycolatopsis sp. GM8 TaxID=2896530 RepID=UPI001F267F12|nr:cytochrome c oxidase assembly protein [Amycolatopsis sp. GM8]